MILDNDNMDLGKFDHDLTDGPKPINDGQEGKSSPFMTQQFRLVKKIQIAQMDTVIVAISTRWWPPRYKLV